MKRRLILAFLALFLASGLAFAQTQTLVLEYVQGNDLTVTDARGAVFTYASGGILEGDLLAPGASLRTGPTTTAELRLKPNGTLIKIAKGTTFRVEGLATPQNNQNGFTLVSGKVRAVATKGSSYDIYTASTVAGVRGTDFSMSYEEGRRARLVVAKGAVAFGRRGAAGEMLDAFLVGAGQFADFFGSFSPQAFTQELFAEEYGDLDIDPAKIPPEDQLAIGQKPPAEPEPASANVGDQSLADAPTDTPEGKRAGRESAERAPESAIAAWLREALGMEIGSITINNQTYAKAVIQPVINLGKLKAALYLPIIYQKNLFDPSDWYRPKGNDEWSFGTDIGWSEKPLEALADAATDLFLKFRYIEYGRPLDDPFFFKVGNLNSFTVGHGLVMRNYANDAEFPAIRRLGFNLGMDMGAWGFEALTNDLLEPEIFGGRLYVRPVPDFKLAFGLSAVADIAPASIFGDDASNYGDPIFIAGGVDLDLPIITSQLLGIRLFADAAAMMPYLRTDAAGYPGVEAGWQLDAVYSDGKPQNWGAAAGLMGNVLFIDWRLEYRYFTGAFRPAFFDSGYERARAQRVTDWAGYLSGDVDQNPSVMGVYGEGGASLFRDKISLKLGYFWPWSADASISEQIALANDYFKAELRVQKGIVPIIDLSGAVIYERKSFVPSIQDGTLRLFDENTVFSGELVMPVPGAPNLDLAFVFSTVMARDPQSGDILLVGNKPKIVPAITLETRLHF
jgi:hypothetical protein